MKEGLICYKVLASWIDMYTIYCINCIRIIQITELGKAVGVTLKEFKKSTREFVYEDEAKEEKND